MKRSVQRVIALVLSLVSIFGMFSLIASADEEPAEPTETVEEATQDNGDNAVDTINKISSFAEKLSNSIYNFLKFLHEMYKTFVLKGDQEDPYKYFFEDDAGLQTIYDDFANAFSFMK